MARAPIQRVTGMVMVTVMGMVMGTVMVMVMVMGTVMGMVMGTAMAMAMGTAISSQLTFTSQARSRSMLAWVYFPRLIAAT